MAALSEEEQLRLAIEASLRDVGGPPPGAAPGEPKKKGKRRILRLIHEDGLHRLKKFDFDSETVLMLKQRIIRSMDLSGVEPNQVTVKLNRDDDRYFAAEDDHKFLPEVGIETNGQKIWVAFRRQAVHLLHICTSFLGPRLA